MNYETLLDLHRAIERAEAEGDISRVRELIKKALLVLDTLEALDGS